MIGLVERWAQQIGWQISERNVIVEGTSDVTLLRCARDLFLADCGIDIFGQNFAVVAAGHGDDGGVEGVNRRLNAARQLAETDLIGSGARKFRFIGLFDNDEAGRRALARASSFDRRVIRYQDVYLLHPVMPLASGAVGAIVERRALELNREFKGLDWEIEDLLSEDLLSAFLADYPTALIRAHTIAGRTHRKFTREGKANLIRFVRDYAELQDVMDLVRLICALRSYLRLRYDYVVS